MSHPDDELTFTTRIKSLKEAILFHIWDTHNINSVIESAPIFLSVLDNLDQIVVLHESVVMKSCDVLNNENGPENWKCFVKLFTVYLQACENLKIARFVLPEVCHELIHCFGDVQWKFLTEKIENYVADFEGKIKLYGNSPLVVARMEDCVEALQEFLKDFSKQQNRTVEINNVLLLESSVTSKLGDKVCPPFIDAGRRLLKHGPFSKINKYGKRIPYYFILFSDVLFFLEKGRSSQKQPLLLYYKRTFSLSECMVQEAHEKISKDFSFVFCSPEKSFIACFSSSEERNSWFDAIKAATDSVKSTSYIQRAPVWVPDELTPNCQICSIKFPFFSRKHHCEDCGKVFCSKCYGNNRECMMCSSSVSETPNLHKDEPGSSKSLTARNSISYSESNTMNSTDHPEANGLTNFDKLYSEFEKSMSISSSESTGKDFTKLCLPVKTDKLVMSADITCANYLEFSNNVPDIDYLEELESLKTLGKSKKEDEFISTYNKQTSKIKFQDLFSSQEDPSDEISLTNEIASTCKRKSITEGLVQLQELAKKKQLRKNTLSSDKKIQCTLIKELEKSEIKFAESLSIIQEFFVDPLKAYFAHASVGEYRKSEYGNCFHFKREKYHPHVFALFDILEQLYSVHREFKNAINPKDFDEINEVDYHNKISRVFSVYFPVLRTLYTQYWKHYNMIFESQGKIINENTDMFNYIKRLEGHHECNNQTFEQFLLAVKNRISDYAQLADSLINSDTGAAQSLLDYVNVAKISVEQESMKWSKELEVVDLSKKFKNAALLKVGRFVLHEGLAQIQSFKTDHRDECEPRNFYVYILSDLLIICQVNAIGTKVFKEKIELNGQLYTTRLSTNSEFNFAMPSLTIEIPDTHTNHIITPISDLHEWKLAFCYLHNHFSNSISESMYI